MNDNIEDTEDEQTNCTSSGNLSDSDERSQSKGEADENLPTTNKEFVTFMRNSMDSTLERYRTILDSRISEAEERALTDSSGVTEQKLLKLRQLRTKVQNKLNRRAANAQKARNKLLDPTWLYIVWPLMPEPQSFAASDAGVYIKAAQALLSEQANDGEEKNKHFLTMIEAMKSFLEERFPDLKWTQMAGPFAKIGFCRSGDELKFKERYGTYFNSFFCFRVRCQVEGILDITFRTFFLIRLILREKRERECIAHCILKRTYF
jgi:hypothetical protein